MTIIQEQVELLRAELRGCIDPNERIQICAELEAAIQQAAAGERSEAIDAVLLDPRPK
jgi:hypothetical protein